MFALDSQNEYADFRNVYNVTGDDICYCPICLGRVKLWNGQNPDKVYQKQRCFHHIDGMCSHESRIHFAYKSWLLERHSKFQVGDKIYEVKDVKIENTLKTTYGNYRPDIYIETVAGKIFYAEVADTNKKTDDYILKWDELGNDVIEIDVNNQLPSILDNTIPVFKLIYSSATGECYIKHYVRQDYDEFITERKIYWKRHDLLNYKIQWEKLDWFWCVLQKYYSKEIPMENVCEAFNQINFEDQKFICSRFKTGKHKNLKYELEKNYSDKKELEKVRLTHISLMIRQLNKEFGFSSSTSNVYLYRKDIHLIFKDNYYWKDRTHLLIDNTTTDKDVYDYFYPVMKKYYEEHIAPMKEKEGENKRLEEYFVENIKHLLIDLQATINNCKNKMWEMSYDYCCHLRSINIKVTLANNYHWVEYTSIDIKTILDKSLDDIFAFIKDELTNTMNHIMAKAKNEEYYYRLMELEG